MAQAVTGSGTPNNAATSPSPLAPQSDSPNAVEDLCNYIDNLILRGQECLISHLVHNKSRERSGGLGMATDEDADMEGDFNGLFQGAAVSRAPAARSIPHSLVAIPPIVVIPSVAIVPSVGVAFSSVAVAPVVGDLSSVATAEVLVAMANSEVSASQSSEDTYKDCESGCCDAMDCDYSECSEPGFVRGPLCCPEDCPSYDPDSTEADLETYQTEAEESASEEENEVRAAAVQLLSLRDSSDGQVCTDAKLCPVSNGEALSSQAGESLDKLERTLVSDLGPVWAPPTSCKRLRNRPKRFDP